MSDEPPKLQTPGAAILAVAVVFILGVIIGFVLCRLA